MIFDTFISCGLPLYLLFAHFPFYVVSKAGISSSQRQRYATADPKGFVPFSVNHLAIFILPKK